MIRALFLIFLSGLAHAQTLQQAIDSTHAAGGGEVKLTCGVFHGSRINLPGSVALVGSGDCTQIPPVYSYGTASARKEGFRVENVWIRGDLADGYIGLDLRHTSRARVRNVLITNVQTGIVVLGQSYYNVFETVDVQASVDCHEIINGANQNTFRGGKCQGAVTGSFIADANNTHLDGITYEVISGTAIYLGSGAVGTTIMAPRLEAVGYSARFGSGSYGTAVINAYRSSAGDYLWEGGSAWVGP